MLENDGRVVSNFVVQALRGEPLTVYGQGSQTRSFCYVSDLVEGLMRLMNGDFIGPVNLGNPDEYTILELAQQMRVPVDVTATISAVYDRQGANSKWKQWDHRVGADQKEKNKFINRKGTVEGGANAVQFLDDAKRRQTSN